MGLKLKKQINKEEMTELYDESYVTELAFYIGANKFIRDLIEEDLTSKVKGIDSYVAFHLLVKFMVQRFLKCDSADIYEYAINYYEDDLIDFIEEYFYEEIGGLENGR